MSRLIDLTGQRFGRLYVLGRDENHFGHPYRREAFWWCQCSCPEHTKISVCGTALRSGHTTSCGCYQRENNHRLVTHKRVYKIIKQPVCSLRRIRNAISSTRI